VPRAVWLTFAGLLALEALYELLGGRGGLVTEWLHGLLILSAALLCLARGASQRPGARAPALWLGAGLSCWWVADIISSPPYPRPPYPSVADLLWLAWYPLTAVGIAVLIREHVAHFELPRWMDGVAVMLIVLTPLAALLLEPAFSESTGSAFARAVTFSYPVLDSLMVGAVVGVYGLLAWRPPRAWVVLGAGCIVMALADGLFAVQDARPSVLDDAYGFLWSAGALLVAYACWERWEPRAPVLEEYGWRIIILPLMAQALAAAIQVYGLFHDLGPVERAVTLVVLLIAMVQIIISRPRAPAG
jgi:hypothetical protein